QKVEGVRARAAFAVAIFLMTARGLDAHSGPPFPVVSNRIDGAYDLSIWADPDATNDGSAAGRFWGLLKPVNKAMTVPTETRAEVSVRPSDRSGDTRSQKTEPVNGDVTRQFAALLLDHEGRFSVRATVEGPLGTASVDTEVDATYDLRPPRAMIAVYMM